MAVCESTPKESTAFTVTVNMPSGVPGSGGGPLLPQIPPVPVAQKLSGVRLAVFGAVVLIDNVVVPLPATDGGVKLQVLSAGSPVQEALVKLTVLL